MLALRQVTWIGRFRGCGGFAVASRGYVNSLLPRMDNLSIAPLEVLDYSDPLRSRLARLPLQGDEFTVLHHAPTTDPEADAHFPIWEFDRVPGAWASILERASLVMTQSTFCKALFERCTEGAVDVHVVPYIIPDQFTAAGPVARLAPRDTCAFGSVFEWVPRKVPGRTIEAFVQEFDRDEPVRLYLRTSHPRGGSAEALVGEWSQGDGRVVTLPDPFPDLAPFYRGLDAYVSCTAGEGYGQTLAEAMACGLPTIASRHGGNLDFMNDANSYLVDVEPWSHAFTRDGEEFRWRLPRVASIRATLRRVFEAWARDDGTLTRPDPAAFSAPFTPERVGATLHGLLRSRVSSTERT